MQSSSRTEGSGSDSDSLLRCRLSCPTNRVLGRRNCSICKQIRITSEGVSSSFHQSYQSGGLTSILKSLNQQDSCISGESWENLRLQAGRLAKGREQARQGQTVRQLFQSQNRTFHGHHVQFKKKEQTDISSPVQSYLCLLFPRVVRTRNLTRIKRIN